MRSMFGGLALLLALVPAGVYAQEDEMDFGAEDMDSMDFEAEDPAPGEEGGELSFESDAQGPPRTVVLVIANPGAGPELAQALTDSLDKYVRATGKYEVVDADDFRAQLFGSGEAAAMDCATNAVCVSGYGKDLWIDSIILGVLYRGEGGWKIEANKVGVEQAEVEGYASQDEDALGSMGAAAVDQVMKTVGAALLGLTYVGGNDDKPPTRLVPMRGPMQTYLAWGTAALAGLFGGLSAVLALQSSATESELQGDSLKQTAAPALIKQGRSQALNANIFIGVSLVVAVGSAALFLIKPLQEVEVAPSTPTPGFGGAEDEEGVSSWWPDVGVHPAGVTLHWSLP